MVQPITTFYDTDPRRWDKNIKFEFEIIKTHDDSNNVWYYARRLNPVIGSYEASCLKQFTFSASQKLAETRLENIMQRILGQRKIIEDEVVSTRIF